MIASAKVAAAGESCYEQILPLEYAENYLVLVQMPTGTGKTYVMASVVKWFLYFLFFLNVIKEKE